VEIGKRLALDVFRSRRSRRCRSGSCRAFPGAFGVRRLAFGVFGSGDCPTGSQTRAEAKALNERNQARPTLRAVAMARFANSGNMFVGNDRERRLVKVNRCGTMATAVYDSITRTASDEFLRFRHTRLLAGSDVVPIS
jgi:hypothetical protein